MQWHNAERVTGGIFSSPQSFVIALAGSGQRGTFLGILPLCYLSLDPLVKVVERKLRGRHVRGVPLTVSDTENVQGLEGQPGICGWGQQHLKGYSEVDGAECPWNTREILLDRERTGLIKQEGVEQGAFTKDVFRIKKSRD